MLNLVLPSNAKYVWKSVVLSFIVAVVDPTALLMVS